MQTITKTLCITLAGLLCAPASATGNDEANARTTDRAPQQVAALLRGIAAGNGWEVSDEVTHRGGDLIGLHLCRSGEDASDMICGQFAILANGAASDIILLHTGTALSAPSDSSNEMHAFAEVLDAASALANPQRDEQFRCDADGCP